MKKKSKKVKGKKSKKGKPSTQLAGGGFKPKK